MAKPTAEHYQKHLNEFAVMEELTHDIIGVQHFSDMHSIAYMVVAKSKLKEIREILKPNRGEIYKGNI